MPKKPIRLYGPSKPETWPRAHPRTAAFAGLGRLRKVALLGGAGTLALAPWTDPTWELWAHASCRAKCKREPDVFFDLHPPELWRDPKKKFWDTNYLDWLKFNHMPIYMQDRYPDVPASIKYPFETMIMEFPRGYMTNTACYMIALALMQGVTHLGFFGVQYSSESEYGPQRGSMEYWMGLAEGRGVHLCIPPGNDLLNRPSLLYGYQSHPNGVRDKSYLFVVGPNSMKATSNKPPTPAKTDAEKLNDGEVPPLFPAEGPGAPELMDIGVAPALDRRPE